MPTTPLTVNIISDLQTLSAPADGTAVIVLGYYSRGDGGGGAFYWNASSTDSTSPFGLVVPITGVITGRFIRILRSNTAFDFSGTSPTTVGLNDFSFNIFTGSTKFNTRSCKVTRTNIKQYLKYNAASTYCINRCNKSNKDSKAI